jgi:hypothetical protein
MAATVPLKVHRSVVPMYDTWLLFPHRRFVTLWPGADGQRILDKIAYSFTGSFSRR